MWVVLVDELTAGHFGLLLRGTRVEVYLRAGAAGACIAHFPEIVVLVAVDDMVGRDMLGPIRRSLIITFQVLFLGTLEYGDVQVGRVEVQYVYKIFPRIVYGSLLEVVAEAPVAEHLEHGVVVGVVPHLLKVVVLAAHAEAFLCVRAAPWLRRPCPEDNVFPLIHTGVSEHQRRVVLDNHRC